ncbi:MAG TPA: DUF411 domain-containing protein [Allosphingosinicella sp.]|nr:DUF411 domain-containing protein [Allosphingosinicella sp.]
MTMNRRTLLAGLPLLFVAGKAAAQAGPAIHVVKTSTCGCCGHWVTHLRQNGFRVTVADVPDVTPTARRLGVPDDLRSCHTASVGGYAVEGHVPAADIRRLLRERPAAAGIAVPGMPMGSPGMEHGTHREPYNTILFTRAGRRSVFARH